MHHLDIKETPGENKARWELYKEAACYFEKILDATLYKTAVVQPLTVCKIPKYELSC